MKCRTGNTSGENSDTSGEESQELLEEGGSGNIGNEEDKSNIEHLFAVVKRKRKKVIELDNFSPSSDSSAFEHAPKKKAKKKKEEKKLSNKKD
eukprot:141247-Ditylum_brightwellii.AAC.1